ncbi:MAG: hypothetical protein DLM72_14950 [Candidatus Nitrosopolaris wilkensis]|nr:MAG: hypothetical protein DLM72_14950 [Candidatus Nitrosopolaris wilkensis]
MVPMHTATDAIIPIKPTMGINLLLSILPIMAITAEAANVMIEPHLHVRYSGNGRLNLNVPPLSSGLLSGQILPP